MVAEYERAKILERSRRGKRHAARRGSVNVLGGAPYGYRYVSKHDGGGVARYEVVEEQARMVRQVFDWVGRDRGSIGEVCRRLRQQGCPTSSGKPAWDRTTIWGLLKNPAYMGEAAFGKTRAGPRPTRPRPVRGGSEQPRRACGLYDVPPVEWISVAVPRLVEPALFEAVREQLAENRRRSRQSARGARYLLQGLLVCAACGYAYYGKAVSLCAAKGKRRDYAYYWCCGSDAYRFGGQRVCANTQVRTDRLDEAVWREVECLLRDPARIATEYERRLDEARRRGADGPDLAAAEAQLAKLRRGMGRLIDSYAEGLIEKAEFEPRVTGFRQRIQGWETQLKAMRDEAALQTTLSLVIGQLEDFARRVHDRMAEVDWPMQRELIRMLVKRVEIERDDVNVVFRVDPAPPAPDPGPPGESRILQDCGRRDDAPLRGACLRREEFALIDEAGFQPLVEDRRIREDIGEQPFVADVVEATLDVTFKYPLRATAHCERYEALLLRVRRGTSGSESVGVPIRRGFRDGFQREQVECLHRPVPHRRNTQRPHLAVALRDEHPSQGTWLVTPPPERQHSFGFGVRRGPSLPVHARRLASVVLGDPPHGKSLAAQRVGQQPLQGFHLAPAAFPNSLHDTRLQPPDGPVVPSPVDTAPVHRLAGGRTRRNCCVHLPSLLWGF